MIFTRFSIIGISKLHYSDEFQSFLCSLASVTVTLDGFVSGLYLVSSSWSETLSGAFCYLYLLGISPRNFIGYFLLLC